MIKGTRQASDRSRPWQLRSGFTLIELLIVMSVIVSLSAILAVTVTGARHRAQVKAAKADIDQIRVGVASFEAEWRALPPSGISALVGALREGTRKGAAHGRLVPSRIHVAPGLKLSGLLEATARSIAVTPAAALPAMTDPQTKLPVLKQFGACKIEEEWVVFSGVAEGALQDCRRGRFGTRAAEHATGLNVLMYDYVDPWGTPYAYTVAEDYGKPGTEQMITLTGFHGRRIQEGQEVYAYEDEGTFQIVSAGPNRRFYSINRDTGEPLLPDDRDDDIRNW